MCVQQKTTMSCHFSLFHNFMFYGKFYNAHGAPYVLSCTYEGIQFPTFPIPHIPHNVPTFQSMIFQQRTRGKRLMRKLSLVPIAAKIILLTMEDVHIESNTLASVNFHLPKSLNVNVIAKLEQDPPPKLLTLIPL